MNDDAEFADNEHHDNNERVEQVDADIYGKPKRLKLFGVWMSRNMAYYVVDLLCFVLLLVSFVTVAVVVEWHAYVWRFYVGFGCFMAFCIVVTEVNRRNKFQSMTNFFHRRRYPLVCVFFALSIGDFILLQLSDVPPECPIWSKSDPDCPLLNPDDSGVRYMTRFTTIVCGALFLCCIMAYWERVSYLSAHNSWFIALLYMSVIGGIFIYFARCLEPPPQREEDKKYNWSWHQTRSINKIFRYIINFMILMVLFFVIMGSIILALFGDASRSSSTLGTGAAMIIFIIIAHIIMITPLAPGSVVDVCAGFLFVSLFVNNEGLSIEAAYFISLALTITLHFSGSCAQYYVGKIGPVQIWANKTLPAEMLAASDSVLKTANWFKVGVVGQVFMDTANGLNQGRMNMQFCTQFWSEYASIPNAIGLVSLGTILAIPSFSADTEVQKYDWAQDAIPLVFMVTSLWQIMASSWGAKELLASSGSTPYWTALEKWTTVQYFYNKKGYVPTKQGWTNDVYQLGATSSASDGDRNTQCLFDIIEDYRATNLVKMHSNYAAASTATDSRHDTRSCTQFVQSLCRQPEQPNNQRTVIIEEKRLNEKSEQLRKQHWARLEAAEYLSAQIENEQLIKVEKEVVIQGYFDESSKGIKLYFHALITLAVFVSGILCYMMIAKNISLSLAVSDGIKSLNADNVSVSAWIALIMFWALIMFYYHREVAFNMKQMAQNVLFLCSGCKSAEIAIETVFDTPKWDTVPMDSEQDEERINLKVSEQ
mmetsp:Transcript_65525/g.104358  ORF Transcript_65525/g.104358 Transcript_65525/m.104358 type:complete len:765 (-) Transcript_65525:153-2447(-)